MGGWLMVRRYWDYQHYKTRNPPWVKWHVNALEDEKLYVQLPGTRLFWTCMLLIASKRDNVVPHDSAWLATESHLDQRTVSRALKALMQAGFLLEFASKSACIAASNDARAAASKSARPREQRTELLQEALSDSNGSKTTETPPAAQKAAPSAQPKECPLCGPLPRSTDLADHLANVHGVEDSETLLASRTEVA